MRDSFFSFHCDPSKWIELRDLLQKGFADVPASEWRPGIVVPKPGNPLGEGEYYRAEHRKAYSAYGGEVYAACGERFLYGAWPQMTPPVAYYARTAVRQALLFLPGICPEPKGEVCMTVFPFPDGSVSEVAAWFTTEWWCWAGKDYFLAHVTSDAVLFAHQFKH